MQKKKNIESKFITEFLNAEKVDDDKYRTKVFKNRAENWITNALSEDIKQAEDSKKYIKLYIKRKR